MSCVAEVRIQQVTPFVVLAGVRLRLRRELPGLEVLRTFAMGHVAEFYGIRIDFQYQTCTPSPWLQVLRAFTMGCPGSKSSAPSKSVG